MEDFPVTKLWLPKGSGGRSKIIRTVYNAPRSAMKKLVVPESVREEYEKYAQDYNWCEKAGGIGFIVFESDRDYAQRQRIKIRPKLHDKGASIG